MSATIRRRFTACAITGERRRKYAVAAALAAMTLLLTVGQ